MEGFLLWMVLVLLWFIGRFRYLDVFNVFVNKRRRRE